MPSSSFACADDWGISYRLTFRASDRRLPAVTAQATGCQDVYGLGPVLWTVDSPEFWKVLAVAAGITPATARTFSGHLA